MTTPVKPRGRGRPRRGDPTNSRQWRLLLEDIAIAEVVYCAVMRGETYRGRAQEAGQQFAKKNFGRDLSLDGIEQIIERFIRKPLRYPSHFYIASRTTPAQTLQSMVNVFCDIHGRNEIKLGKKTLRRSEVPLILPGDRDVPERIRKTFPRVVRKKSWG